jgi:hypothetical protein
MNKIFINSFIFFFQFKICSTSYKFCFSFVQSIGPDRYAENDIEEMKDRVVDFISENIWFLYKWIFVNKNIYNFCEI